jgi:hypothetical protein
MDVAGAVAAKGSFDACIAVMADEPAGITV